jgi:dTMP kinase
MLPARSQLHAYRALMRNRNWRVWFASSFASSLGDWTGLVALQALVISLAEPGQRIALFGLGGIMMARLLPSVLIGPVAGVVADRYDRRRLMVVTDVARGLLFVGVAFSRDLIALFALTFLIECLSLLYMAAKDASLPRLVERGQLAHANQLNLLVGYGPLPLGGVVAASMVPVAGLLRGVGIPVSGTMLALLVNACTFFVGGAIIARLRLPPRRRTQAPAEGPRLVAEFREGVGFIRELPLIRALITGVVGVFFGAGVVVTLGPEFVRTTLGRAEEDWYGLMTVVGVGLLAGILVAPFAASRLRKERLFPVFLAATGAVAVVIATLPTYQRTLGAGSLLGFFAGLSFVLGYTLLHEHTRDDVRARTFAAFYVTTRIAMFSALALAPFVAGAVGRTTLIIGGRVITMSGIRLTMLAAGIVALWSAVSAWRGMYRALRQEGDRDDQMRLGAAPPRRAGGRFIAFEGVEGSGKSTHALRLAATLKAEGREVVVTREPGGAPLAERVRHLLLDPNADPMDARTEALLYAAARAEHVRQVIRPALQAGKVVISDRFVHSSLAYQGFARGLGLEDVLEINRWATDGVFPDVVVFLYVDPDEGLRRAAERARRETPASDRRLPWLGTDRMEREDMEFHRRVADGFLELAHRDRKRFLVVDAMGDADTVARQVRSGLHPWLPLPATRHPDGGSDAPDRPAAEHRPEATG